MGGSNMEFRRCMKLFLFVTSLASVSWLAGFEIFIDYSFDEDTGKGGINFFDPNTTKGIQARQALDAAATELASWLNDSFAPIEPGGADSWNAFFFSPVTSTLATESIPDLVVGANSITVFAGGFAGGSSSLLGQAGRGSYTGLAGSAAFTDSVLTRGGGSDYVMWGGMVRFRDRTDWHMDHTTLPGSGHYDFYTVAMHELLHVLGFGQSPNWSALRSGLEFFGPHSVEIHNLTNSDTENPLSSVPLADAEHWNNSIQSIVASDGFTLQDTLMGPTLLKGQRLELTLLDLAGIADIGWEVKGINYGVIPEPGFAALVAGGLCLILLLARRRCAA